MGAHAVVDTKVDHDDVQGVFVLELGYDEAVLEQLATASVVPLVSLYCTRSTPNAAESAWRATQRGWRRWRLRR